MEPRRDDYANQFDYIVALDMWDRTIARERMRQVHSAGTNWFVGTGTRLTNDRDVTSTNDVEDVNSISSFEDVPIIRPKKQIKMDEKVLKQRHLGRDERSLFHQPKSDWCESPKGDVCKSACSLEISDLVAKIK